MRVFLAATASVLAASAVQLARTVSKQDLRSALLAQKHAKQQYEQLADEAIQAANKATQLVRQKKKDVSAIQAARALKQKAEASYEDVTKADKVVEDLQESLLQEEAAPSTLSGVKSAAQKLAAGAAKKSGNAAVSRAEAKKAMGNKVSASAAQPHAVAAAATQRTDKRGQEQESPRATSSAVVKKSALSAPSLSQHLAAISQNTNMADALAADNIAGTLALSAVPSPGLLNFLSDKVQSAFSSLSGSVVGGASSTNKQVINQSSGNGNVLVSDILPRQDTEGTLRAVRTEQRHRIDISNRFEDFESTDKTELSLLKSRQHALDRKHIQYPDDFVYNSASDKAVHVARAFQFLEKLDESIDAKLDSESVGPAEYRQLRDLQDNSMKLVMN
eukprot:g10623.t1